MSMRPEANLVRALELVELDSATKAVRLFDAVGNSVLMGINGEKGSGVLFAQHANNLYVVVNG